MGKGGLAAEAAAGIYYRFKITPTCEEDVVELTDSNVYRPELYELAYVKKYRELIAQCTTRPVPRRT